MDEDGFVSFLRKKGKTDRTISSCVENAKLFEAYLERIELPLQGAGDEQLNDFINSTLEEKTVSKFMWTLQYYFIFTGCNALLKHSKKVRESYTAQKRKSFKLKDFRNVNQEAVERLSHAGIDTVDDMLKASKTMSQRKELSRRTGIDAKEILEIAKLSNLTRLGAVKSVRARLYYDSGFDTIEKIARITPEELIKVTRDFIKKTGFDGIPPAPKEAANAVRRANELADALELQES